MDCEEKQYAIREVSQITGVKPVTLRAWQRRYNLIQPHRTEKGHRIYTERHVALIGEIQSWLSKGVPIGKVKNVLEVNDSSEVNELPLAAQLTEVPRLLEALVALNQTKADSIIGMVLKEYPLDIVEQQFIQPVEKALSMVRFGSRSLQTGMMRTLMVARLNDILQAENKAAGNKRAALICYESVNDIQSRLWALKLSQRGLYMVIIDGVDELSGLIDHPDLNAYDTLALYSSKPLNAAQTSNVERLKQSFAGTLVLSEMIESE
ncbi:MerR family transcriptional regulator [Vibrio brasiliensis]|uniref:MerR family transcriptional regulator n=1 Tax=Vibrio brasiliensis TaxID=170652 RepID=UPI001EFCAD7A|nr:MerR family transcriptional regulator [Vibrio brasiliensis]MCG9726596.1 MerR family transcriptional regulator [Vibrio brasiliensis]